MTRFRLLSTLACCLAALAAVACSRATENYTPHPLTEAYSLMDRGENGKAILLLERVNAEDGGTSESRLLLASAYAGEAGLDVYQLHRTFQDLLFRRALSDQLWNPEAEAPDAPTGPKLLEALKDRGPAPLERLMANLDRFLNELRSMVQFLDRFPQIPPEKWPLLDRALETLQDLPPTKDVALYRTFIRLVYLETYLREHLLADHLFGSRQWACTLQLEDLRQGLVWVAGTLVASLDDLSVAFPRKMGPLHEFHAITEALLGELQEARSNAPTGSASSLLVTERSLRSVFNCAGSQSNP